uniref:MAK10-like protein n=1 Tax=Tanacetum cinerariifolium TaxID=118510 RepID=A0A6L2M363_TANCI|nr:MAK10-like protein [Tanacetum cinerariifolium]
MEDENPICTLKNYSRPSHEGYRNTIELPDGNNAVPLRSDTIRLVQNGCSFHGLRSEDPNQHLKDFLKLMDSLDLDVANRERTRLHLFQFSLHDQASNWLERLVSNFQASQDARLSQFEADFKQQQDEMTNKIDTVLKAINDRITGPLPSDTVKNLKLNVNYTTPVLSTRSYPMKDPQCSTRIYSSINAITICSKQPNKSRDDKSEGREEKGNPENINTTPPSPPDPSISFIIEKVRKLNLFLESSGLDIILIIDPRLSQVVLEKPFVETSNMTHYLLLGVVRFTSGIDEIAYKMPHKIEQYNSLSDLEKEHTKSVYFRNEEDRRRGVDYVMSKILGFYKECLELGTKYLTRLEDEGGVT